MKQATFFDLPEEPNAIIRELRNYLAGRAAGISQDDALLEEVLKILFCMVKFSDIKPTNDEVETAKTIRSKFSKIRTDLAGIYTKDEEILLNPTSIHFVFRGLYKILNNPKSKIDVVASLYQAFIGNHIRGQEGQFFTPQVAVEFLVNSVGLKPDWKVIDTACGACSFLCESYAHLASTYPTKKVKFFGNNNLFGIEKDEKLARLARIHLSILTGGMAHIYTGDSLAFNDRNLKNIKDGMFDLVITNPPFGAKIKSADEETSRKYELGFQWKPFSNEYIKTNKLNKNTPPQVLFMERNIRALKDNGILATVIPESLVSNKNYKNVVQYLLRSCIIEAVIGMPESLFKTSGKSGTHTKTCLLIARKKNKDKKLKKQNIFLAEAKWCGHDSRGNQIPKNDLPDILNNYLKFKKGLYNEHTHLGYVIDESKIEDFILAPRYYDIEIENAKKKISKKSELVSINELVEKNILEISTGDEVGKLAYGTGDVPYIRTSDITNWEIKLDVKHRVDREIYDKFKNKQNIKEGDILMVKDGTYLIGSLAIITKYDVVSIYQSHIYKIRVLKNSLGLTPYNMLGLLSSAFVQRQIKSKQLTQDIIDSLGKRIYDLLLPIPKNKKELNALSDNMQAIIKTKAEAKNKTDNLLEKINLSFS